jgi:membrane-associated HD superfamily phosphohydrolase
MKDIKCAVAQLKSQDSVLFLFPLTIAMIIGIMAIPVFIDLFQPTYGIIIGGAISFFTTFILSGILSSIITVGATILKSKNKKTAQTIGVVFIVLAMILYIVLR